MNVVVTGSSGGVGREIVARYARAGALVAGIDKVGPRLPSEHHHVDCDLASEERIASAVRHVRNAMDRIDLLVHAAGVFHDDSATADCGPAALQELWHVNYLGPCLLSEQLLPLLRAGRDPSVVFVASADAIVASGGQTCEIGVCHDLHYAASKGALVTATRALAMRWAVYGVRVNAVCPTIVRSPMTADLLAIPNKENQLASQIPLGRICEPSDVATAVEVLYRLTMTTAHVLPVDGGYLCR
jgi:NAD(P)-dependent dehydrogenase (short-subunit alcohol dehydrogenase family)